MIVGVLLPTYFERHLITPMC